MENNNNKKYNINNTSGTHDFQPFSCPTGKEIVYGGTTRTTTFEFGSSSGSKKSSVFIPCNLKYQQQNPRKKRTKLVKLDGGYGVRSSSEISRPKYGKKPDPSAPKITTPCTECGKKFWSWKALFGHMRCHPERDWRGINPPVTVTSSVVTKNPKTSKFQVQMSVEDHEVATCLLMLANGYGSPSSSESPTLTTAYNVVSEPDFLRDPNPLMIMGCRDFVDSDGAAAGFECSSCKKVFGSHQALGGHRASHKNVKGCFAIHKNGSIDDDEELQLPDRGHLFGEIEVVNKEDDDKLVPDYDPRGHKCEICLRVFSSGQALGGHKRCHWEKGGEDQKLISLCGGGLDLNFPPPPMPMLLAPVDSSGMALDLRLGL